MFVFAELHSAIPGGHTCAALKRYGFGEQLLQVEKPGSGRGSTGGSSWGIEREGQKKEGSDRHTVESFIRFPPPLTHPSKS